MSKFNSNAYKKYIKITHLDLKSIFKQQNSIKYIKTMQHNFFCSARAINDKTYTNINFINYI